MATLLSDLQAAQVRNLTVAYKAQINRDAATIAAYIALYYKTRVNVSDPQSVEDWLNIFIPRLIKASDDGAGKARAFFDAVRRLELGNNDYRATASLGALDSGVSKSLLTVGPYDLVNKMRQIEALGVSPQRQKALIAEAQQVTTKNLAAAAMRHAQAGSRQTLYDNANKDETALGWVRVTQAKPCAFCAMLASRGLQYRAFKQDSFVSSDARFTGDGDAKVHDGCGCSLKGVYSKNDPVLDQNQTFADMWSMWGAGGRGETDAALRFRRGYDHWRDTGDYLTWDQVDKAA